MPSSFPSKVRHNYDAESVLRALGSAAITATADSDAFALDSLQDAYWDNGEVPLQTFSIVIFIEDAETGVGDETYEFSVEVDSTEAFDDTPVVVGTLTASAPGAYVVNLDGPTISALDDNAAFIRVNAALGGAAPSLTYAAWVAPAVRSY